MGRTSQPGRGSRLFRLRPVTAVAFAVLLVATVTTATVIGRIADEHEERILEERTREVGVFLESSIREIELAFPYLAGVLQLAADPVQGFELAAGSLVDDSVRSVGVARRLDGPYQVAAAVGDGPVAGASLGDEWEPVLARAVDTGEVVTDVLPATDQHTRVGFAYAPEDLPVALFLEMHFDPPNVIEQDEGSPFGDIKGAVYAGLEPSPSRLVLTTADELPLTGDVVRDTVGVGGDEWLILTTTERSLAGPLVSQTRWGVLAGGLALALLTATIVEMLGRRRVYAMRLVEEKTAELREARRSADEANQTKSEFLSRMSHELRTPLNAVLGFGQLLELESTEAERQDSVQQILKAGRHLLDLINEVLDISRVEAGELALSPEAVHVPELLQDAVDLIRPLASQHGIQVVVDSRSADDYVFADRQRAKQVLLNLLSNAVKYNRPRGTVAVSCARTTGTTLRISVADTGHGIPTERLEQLFVPFERLGAEHSGVEGTGIGLALSKRLAEAMDGTLSADSVLGEGSTFTVEFPRVEGPVQRYERLNGARGAAADDPASGRRHVVLHIEDNLSNATLVERIFAQRTDLELLPAMQGRLGLELARENLPDVVLLDLHLPDMSGEEILQRLRDDPFTASIPVIIVSADATAGHVQRLLSSGATAYITKPINVHELLDALDAALGQPQAR